MREIGVHDDNIVAGDELETVNVCRSKTKLSCARFEEDMGRVGFCELVCDHLGSVRGSVVNDDELPVELAARRKLASIPMLLLGSLELVLLGERAVQEPGYYREVASLVVSRENDRVFVFGDWGHFG